MRRVTLFAAMVAGMLGLVPSFTGQTIVTSPPPSQVVLVPHPYLMSLTKHPTLPVVYGTFHSAPESRNLVTFRLNADGTLLPGGQKEWDDFFTADPKNPDFAYRLYRPTVNAVKNILYLGQWPYDVPKYFANTNNAEVVAVSLDEQGLPAKLLRRIRTDYTTKESLVDLRYEPTMRRLILSYWTTFGWCAIGEDGLPTTGHFNAVPAIMTTWYMWLYVPEWQRFYATRPTPSLMTFKLTADGLGLEYLQSCEAFNGGSGQFELSTRYRRAYNLDLSGPTLVSLRLTKDGRFTGMPRYLPVPGAVGLRCDSKNGKLYLWNADTTWKTYTLDADGWPTGAPQVSKLGCVVIRDVWVDEPTGKVYVGCPQLPTPVK